MDHSYSTEREKHLWKDHCYFSVGKKTPRVITRKAQLLKEQQSGEQGSGWQDHTYTRFNPRLISGPDKENTSLIEAKQVDSEGNLLEFSARDGCVYEGISLGATETIGVIKIEPGSVILEPAKPVFIQRDHTYDQQLGKPRYQPSKGSPQGARKTRREAVGTDHAYFGKLASEVDSGKSSPATLVNKCDYFKVKDHSYLGKGGMRVKEEPE